MNREKVIFCCLCLLMTGTLLLPGTAAAQDRFEFGLQANPSAIEAMGKVEFDMPTGVLTLGGNLLVDEDDYDLLGFHTLVGNVVDIEALTGQLGFKAVAGEAERSGSDSDVLVLAFSAGVQYDLSRALSRSDIPVTLHSYLHYAPDPTAFDDSDEYFEFIAGADWKILENGALTANYRYLEMDFEDPVNWQETDNDLYLGMKFMF